MASRLQGIPPTIFSEMSALAVATGAVNLGQGFPDTDGPREVLDGAIAAIEGGLNQYPPGPGMAVLREAIAEHQRRFWGLSYDPDREVLVTAEVRAVAGRHLAFQPIGAVKLKGFDEATALFLAAPSAAWAKAALSARVSALNALRFMYAYLLVPVKKAATNAAFRTAEAGLTR